MDDLITDKPDMIQQLLSEDADLDNSLVLLRDFIRDLFAPSDVDEPTPEEETIELSTMVIHIQRKAESSCSLALR